jgi:hypothetical protein
MNHAKLKLEVATKFIEILRLLLRLSFFRDIRSAGLYAIMVILLACSEASSQPI